MRGAFVRVPSVAGLDGDSPVGPAELQRVLAAAFPDMGLTCRLSVQSRRSAGRELPLRVLWTDGPSEASVSALAASVAGEGRAYCTRLVSAGAAARVVGLEVLASGVPPLPPAGLFEAAGVDSPLASPCGVEEACLLGRMAGYAWPGLEDDPFLLFAERVLGRLDSLDLSAPLGLGPGDAAALECFVTLVQDSGFPGGGGAEAAVFAASGGWAAATALVS